MIQQVVPGMRERRFGRVVSVSLLGGAGADRDARCSPTRTGPACWARSRHWLAISAGDGITLNTILPGRIATDRIAHLHGSIEEAEKVARDEIPAGRLGTAEEIAAAAAFLCSERASYITGHRAARGRRAARSF